MSEVQETMFFYFIEETTQLLEAFIIKPYTMENKDIQQVADKIRDFIEAEYGIWLESQLSIEIRRFKEHKRISVSSYMVKRLSQLLNVASSMAVVFAKIVLVDKLAFAMTLEIKKDYWRYPEGSYDRCCWNMVIPAFNSIVTEDTFSVLNIHTHDFWYSFKNRPQLLKNMLFGCQFTDEAEKYVQLIRSPEIPPPQQAFMVIDESDGIIQFKDYFCPRIITIN